MKKHAMLGVNDGYCCLLLCLVPFGQLDAKTLEPSDFIHKATNWGGRDRAARTIDIWHLKMTGRKLSLEKPLLFRGVDCDCGREFRWTFRVDEIYELEESDENA